VASAFAEVFEHCQLMNRSRRRPRSPNTDEKIEDEDDDENELASTDNSANTTGFCCEAGRALTRVALSVHIVHMKTISIRELHLNTGEWVRQASRHKRVVITERGDPVATLIPFEQVHAATRFAARKLLPSFVKLPALGRHDSSKFISEDRDRT
jgi:prevent-host-death family protein